MSNIVVLENTVHNLEFMLFAKLIPSDSVDLIIEDPPYGVEYDTPLYNDSVSYVKTNIDDWLSENKRILKEGHHIYIFVPTKEIDLWVSKVKIYFNFNNILSTRIYGNGSYCGLNNFKYDTQLVIYASKGTAINLNVVDYQKTSSTWKEDSRNKNPKEYSYNYDSFFKMYSSVNLTDELIFGIFIKLLDKLEVEKYLPTSYYEEPRSNIKANADIKRRHSNEKNPLFIRILILLSSKPNEIVLDGFAGSGSVGEACQLVNRKYILNDKNEDCYDIINNRLKGISTKGINTNKIIY